MRTRHAHTISAALAATLLMTLAFAVPAGATLGSETLDRSGTLQNTNQSMWAAGSTGEGPEEKVIPFFDQSFSASGSGGEIVDVKSPTVKVCNIFNESLGEDILSTLEGKPECADEEELSFDLGKFGAEGGASVKGEVGMSLALHGFAPGSVKVTYPVTGHYTIPKPESFAAGDTVTIGTSETVNAGATLQTSFPTLSSAALQGLFGFHAAANFNLCFFKCTEKQAFEFGLPEGYDGSNPATGTLLEVSNPGTQCFDFIAGFVAGFGHAPDAYTRCHNEKTGVNSGYVGLPDVHTSSTLESDGSLSASGEDPYVVVPVSAVTWATRILPGKPPVPLNLGPAEIPGTGVILGWNTAQLVFTDIETMRQAFTFKPRVDTTLEWGRTLEYTVTGPHGETIGSGPGTGATFPLGDTLKLQTPADLRGTLQVTPSLSMGQAQFTNHTSNLSIGEGEFSALGVTLETPETSTEVAGFKFGIPGVKDKFGPVYRKEFPLATTTSDILDDSWTLGGFNRPLLEDLPLTPDPPPVPTPVTVHPVEGASFSGTVASFADPDTTGKASDYTAKISWGDGAVSEDATLVDDGNGVFHAVGTHTYKEEGSYPVDVTIQDDEVKTLIVTDESLAEVADAPLHASADTNTTTASGPALLWPAPPSSGKLASFTDEDPEGTLSDYSASVQWGDGATTASATIAPNGKGGWDVSAAHEYAQLGPHTVTLTVDDEGGSSTSTTFTLIQYAYSLGGDFAIQPAPVGSQVTFWGARWSAANPLVQAPSSFKGWADSAPTPPGCDSAWATRPGNSSVPPLVVPAYVAVLETGPVEKSGSQISGKAQGVAIVRSEEGYAPDPGHAGTGTVIAQACQR
ncbi:MAG TPA: hypothetical protein VFW38_03820 [Solirubrobacteraceae bacterium]|nr:hypothetical protein [Solirubrobacteraceae bacterium]